ncbi:MAG TPA: sigma-70 family RNA polymerase sigma factor [Ktedonobacterales bacterium]
MAADEELFREWQQGSAGALEALVQRHHAPLLAHLTRLTGNPLLAEDLTQETFLRLVRDGASYRYPRPFLPWFYTIARHLARNALQSAYARHVEHRQTLPDSASDEPDPADWLERWERREGLRMALATLTFEQREALSLRFGQELTVQETAAVLGVPEGTVKSRTFTALRRLRDALKQREVSDDLDQRREDNHG